MTRSGLAVPGSTPKISTQLTRPTEFGNLVQRDGVDAVVGYVSSGNCLTVTPIAAELKTLTVLYDCGAPRIFEEAPRKSCSA